MEPNVFIGYLKRGIVGVLSSFEHEQYPFDGLDQNNSAHGVYSVALNILVGLCITVSHVKMFYGT
jgi:hypothetical protein